MPEEKVRFMFALSSEGTKLLKEGTLRLSSGGLRRSDGSLYEMATPVYFKANHVEQNSDYPARLFQMQFDSFTTNLDQTMQDVSALKEIAWMDYAVNCRTYELTYRGFQRLIEQLEGISGQIARVERKIDNKEFNDRLELANKYKNHLKSIAGYMEINGFNASASFLNIAEKLDDIAAYFERLYNELITETGNDQIVLASIVYLMGPYTYVVRRYSALFYYENNCYPPNYQKWVESVSKITKNICFKNKFLYCSRVYTDCSLEDALIATSKAVNNLKGYVRQIGFDQAYVLRHTKDEYLSIGRQLQEKIEAQDYQIINGHICIELKDNREKDEAK